MTFSIHSILPLRRDTQSELVAKAYRLASERGIKNPKVELRAARAGEVCRFGVPARTVVEVRG